MNLRRSQFRAANPGVEILTEHKIRFALNDLRDPWRVRLWLEGRIDRLELHPDRNSVPEGFSHYPGT